ncbi:MAG: hypothetical protein IIC79_01735 [Chloroflexi bacterium]|nr:hypothetical protein [Chloroflexota bacterium]
MSPKNILLIVLVGFIAVFTSGCGAISGLFATETPTPTNTPLPTSTPTPVPTSTPTPVPTDTPPPTVVPILELSEIRLSVEDLPAGFIVIKPEDFGFSTELLSVEGFQVAGVFAFLELVNTQIVIGFTVDIPTPLEMIGFDLGLQQPGFLVDAFIGGLAGADILEQESLADLNDVGDSSTGVTILVDFDGIEMRFTMIVFRRGSAAAFLLLMHPDGTDPTVDIEKLANKLDALLVVYNASLE